MSPFYRHPPIPFPCLHHPWLQVKSHIFFLPSFLLFDLSFVLALLFFCWLIYSFSCVQLWIGKGGGKEEEEKIFNYITTFNRRRRDGACMSGEESFLSLSLDWHGFMLSNMFSYGGLLACGGESPASRTLAFCMLPEMDGLQAQRPSISPEGGRG